MLVLNTETADLDGNLGQCRMPFPDEGAARERWPRHDVEAPDLESVKDFLRFYIATSQPKLADKPNVDSINTVAEWFFAGFTRITGTETKGRREERCVRCECSRLSIYGMACE
jgi:hypothetical protein